MDSRRRTACMSVLAALPIASGCIRVELPRIAQTPPPAEIHRYITVDTFASRLGLRVESQSSAMAVLKDDVNTVTVFAGDSGYIYVNGERFGQPSNAITENGRLYVLIARQELLSRELKRLRLAKAPPPPPPPAQRRVGRVTGTVVVDAGHGGKDPGASGISSVPEKTIVLDVARRLQDRIAERGAHVIMTRDDDRFIELDDRAATADRYRADAFVAIHADSAQRSSASGATLYISRTASHDSVRLAQSLDSALRAAGIECRGTQRAGYRVLVGHSRPAVLVECGFLTNPGDVERLASPAYRARIADALADGLAQYLSR